MTTNMKLLARAGVVIAAMVSALVLGLPLSFCCFTSSSGQADFTTLFVLGLTTLFISIYSKVFVGSASGYLVSVLLPAALWIGLHMLMVKWVMSPRTLYNASASFVIVSVIYFAAMLMNKMAQKSPEGSEEDQQSEPF